ncbi:hypothetical protein SLEP1_g31622 [Rubroshorea leprosula]|uniref:Uncharacterized protein n=1 Tax=Rubroshorea leprosula TaxID=152421 RepID=A0AAV5K9J3_9ROSI|nr:hypothetical protein SLEP1_g31622 [Rubroshorea leprosula]
MRKANQKLVLGGSRNKVLIFPIFLQVCIILNLFFCDSFLLYSVLSSSLW